MAFPKTPTLNVPAGVTNLPIGNDVAFFEVGVAAYEHFRPNSEVDVTMPDGSVRKVTVRSTQVAPLIDLIMTHGSRHVSAQGQVYSANNLVRSLTEASSEAVLDVTKLYTAVMVMAPMTPAMMPGMPTATA